MEESIDNDAAISFACSSDGASYNGNAPLRLDQNEVKQLQKRRLSYSLDSCDLKAKTIDFSKIKREVKELQKIRFSIKDKVEDNDSLRAADEETQLQQGRTERKDEKLLEDIVKYIQNEEKPISSIHPARKTVPEVMSNKNCRMENLSRRKSCETTLNVQSNVPLNNYQSPPIRRMKLVKSTDNFHVHKYPMLQTNVQKTTESAVNSGKPLTLEESQIEHKEHSLPSHDLKNEEKPSSSVDPAPKTVPEVMSNKNCRMENFNRRKSCETTLNVQSYGPLHNYQSPPIKRMKLVKSTDNSHVHKYPMLETNVQKTTESAVNSGTSLTVEESQIEHKEHTVPSHDFKKYMHSKPLLEKSTVQMVGSEKSNTSRNVYEKSSTSNVDDRDLHFQSLRSSKNKKRVNSLNSAIEYLYNKQREQTHYVRSNKNNTVIDPSLNINANSFKKRECNGEFKVETGMSCITSESSKAKQIPSVLDNNLLMNNKNKSFVEESHKSHLTAVIPDPRKPTALHNENHIIECCKSKETEELDNTLSLNKLQKYMYILCSDTPEGGEGVQSVTCGDICITRRTDLNDNQSSEKQNSCNSSEIVCDEHNKQGSSPNRLTNFRIPSEVSLNLIQPLSDKASSQRESKIYNSATLSKPSYQIKSPLTTQKTDPVILSDITTPKSLEPNQQGSDIVQTNSLKRSHDLQATKQKTAQNSSRNIVTAVQNVASFCSPFARSQNSVSPTKEPVLLISSPPKIITSQKLNIPGSHREIPLINLDETLVPLGGIEVNYSNDNEISAENSRKCDSSHNVKTNSITKFEKHKIGYISTPSTSLCSQSLPSTIILDSESSQSVSTELQNLKLSYNVSQNPKKFSPQGKVNVFDVLMGKQKTPVKKSPTKRLGKNSPIKYMLKNKTPKILKYRTASPNKITPIKKLDFGETGGKLSEKQPTATETVNTTYLRYSEEFVTYFESILDDALNDSEMLPIVQKECEDITAFKNLEDLNSKKLYIRMLGRKYTWHRVSDIKYDDIGSDDIKIAFSDLEKSGFVTSDYSKEKLEVILEMLKKPELQSLCKTFRIQPGTMTKPKLIDALLNYGQQQTVLGKQNSSSSSLISNRSREYLRHCIKLCEDKRQSFLRVFLLFSLPHHDIEEDREVSKQLSLFHFVKTGRVQYPTFKIQKEIPIFSAREELNCFEEANELLTELTRAMDAKNWCDAHKCGEKASEQLDKILNNSFVSSRVAQLPLFLRRYAGGSTYAYVMHRAIEACKKKKELIPSGANILRKLLSQDIYLPQYRGNWYEQLALLQQVHFKNYLEAAETVVTAMNDVHLNEVQQQALSARGLVLVRRKEITNDLKMRLVKCIKEPLVDPPNITIKAKALQTTDPGYKKVYIQEDREKGEITYSSVEEFVISHYKSRGYSEGVHAEGSIVITLFGLMFWDIIYEHPVPDVFRNPYQREPLDLCSNEFYKHRKEVIDKRLTDMSTWNLDQVKSHVLGVLCNHEGKESIVNWQRFRNIGHIMSFVECLTMGVLTKILERVVKSYRSVRKGFPDLAVWSPSKKECKFVEVKGPNDRLSIPQKLWIDYLTKCNIQCAEVCYVETSGSKALQRRKRARPTFEDGEDL